MENTDWRFYETPDGSIDVDPPAHIDPATRTLVRTAILDWLFTDVGRSPTGIAEYRSALAEAQSNGSPTVIGNGTAQTLAADRVILESLYEQWDDVTLSGDDFERVLDNYQAFIVGRADDRV
ncbi:hypothetical protein [Pseudofrankia asymbiotica]|uniref:Uncharacterized protein n=1 Tax=Pseudofrankia asymbiotica TaxID=1834516 RepID=A0A1V2IF32_9ACTN|nr:hypothetical protein [Pseudofrankia asymbiotica]ONH31076.1 hypothetical protein BL253_11135 [Pseudofrankia asymbiotica]